MARISALVHKMFDNKTYAVYPPCSRMFGGSATQPREARMLAYAWRQHRRSGNSAPFMFTIVGRRRLNRRLSNGATHVPKSIVGFVTDADRKRGIECLRTQGFTHFTCFRDVNAEYALQFGKSPDGRLTINW